MLLLSGCMVGPKYVKPTVPLAPEYKETKTGGGETYKEAGDMAAGGSRRYHAARRLVDDLSRSHVESA